jgi:hypothetical protein
MKEVKIIVNGNKELDLYGEQSISLNYQIEDLENPNKKKGSYSKTIKVPGTKNNNKIFSSMFDVNIDLLNFNPLKSIKCSFIVGGLIDKRISNLQILNVNNINGEIEYEVSLSSNLKNIVSSLSNESINRLDFSEYNHERNLTNIQNSWSNYCIVNSSGTTLSMGEGYVYPYIINGGKTDILDTAYLEDMYPSLFVKEIMDKIFINAGFTYTSDFLDSEYFKKLIIPFNNEDFQLPEDDFNERRVNVGVGTSTQFKVFTTNDEAQVSTNLTNLQKESGTTADGSIEWSDTGDQWDTNTFVSNSSGYFNIEFDGVYTASYDRNDNGSNINYKSEYNFLQTKVQVQRVGTSTWDTIDSNITTFTPSTSSAVSVPFWDNTNYINHGISVTNLFLDTGDKIRLNHLLNVNQKWNNPINNSKVDCKIYLMNSGGGISTQLTIEPVSNVVTGVDEIFMNQTLPNVKQKDFFLDIVKMFNLFIDDDVDNPNNLIIEPREDFFNSRQRLLDWTDKVDRNKNYKITPLSDIDFNKLTMKYKDDTDYLNTSYKDEFNESYGELNIEIENDFSKKDDKLELLFSPTPITDDGINDRVAPFFTELTEEGYSKKSVNTRILFYGGLVDCEEWYIKEYVDATGVNSLTLTQYPYCGMLDHPTEGIYDLSFGKPSRYYHNLTTIPNNDLYNQFHKTKFIEITDRNAKLLEVDVYLTDKDISDFDFRDTIFIDGQYWRVQKIKDYNPLVDDTTTIVLSKIKDINFVTPDKVEVPTSNSFCPVDVVIFTSKSGHYYSSKSGQIITKECCDSLGGIMSNGMCSPEYFTDPFDDWNKKDDKTKTTEEQKQRGEDVAKGGSGKIGVKDNLFKEKVSDNTYKNNYSNITKGTHNYISPTSYNNILVGNNNSIPSDTSNQLVIGDNIEVEKTNTPTLYLGNIKIDENGVITSNNNIIDGGLDEVMNVSKTNLIDIIDGGIDSVRNYGGDSKNRPIIDNN